jgi:dipeptidase
VTSGSDYSELSRGCAEHAAANGWWAPADGPFDFAAAYRDQSVIPPVVSSGRYRTTCAALARSGPSLDLGAVERLMRDHYGSGDVHAPGFAPDDERFFSICMHSGAVGMTAASMVVELGPTASAPRVAWITFCNPCVAPYLPVFVEAPVPAEYERGGRSEEGGGAWWRFKKLLAAVESDFSRHARRVRDSWNGFERELEGETAKTVAGVAGKSTVERRAALERFMADVWEETARRLDALLRALG